MVLAMPTSAHPSTTRASGLLRCGRASVNRQVLLGSEFNFFPSLDVHDGALLQIDLSCLEVGRVSRSLINESKGVTLDRL
mmetsp:Transcript_157/g.272  ORF Transcript_157/g.272 Transcript_157/m.272 type:complete len:80 (-) Transcript_157:5-244(-)